MYQYERNDQYASDFTLIRKEHAIESINDFSSIFVLPKPTAPIFRRPWFMPQPKCPVPTIPSISALMRPAKRFQTA